MTLLDNQMNIFGDESNSSSMVSGTDNTDKLLASTDMKTNEASEEKPIQEEMSYESAVAQLEQVVARLESGDSALDESMELFQLGMKLTDFCSRKLNSMEEKITKLMLQADGSITEIPLEEADNGKV